MVDRGVDFLRTRGQADDGSFSAKVGVGPTGLALSGLLSVGVPAEDPMVEKGLKYLEQFIQPDGGIYSPDSTHRNYDTCIAMVAFQLANTNGRYSKLVAGAERYIKDVQWDETEGLKPSDPAYGGAGYGSRSRPDLSNTSFMIDSLKSLGRGADDEAIQKALEFVSRCQNLESPANNTEFAAKINDGGFYYTVAGGGESKAGVEPNGGLRSYGSMSYSGLKSMIYAGVKKDDPRVKAVIEFLRKNYDLENNPGVGKQGLFYYYHTMAKALEALGERKFVDESKASHDWKAEMFAKLASLQQPDGSWVNAEPRWLEGDPNLVTAYVLLTMAHLK